MTRDVLNLQNAQGDTAVTWSVWHRHTDCLKELLAHGADANIRTHKGESALMIACFQNLPECVKLLLECDAATVCTNATTLSAG